MDSDQILLSLGSALTSTGHDQDVKYKVDLTPRVEDASPIWRVTSLSVVWSHRGENGARIRLPLPMIMRRIAYSST
ncbi:hypothetical protein O6P43_001787 [Quillaja saponaria]|uniref:Uncharacterized protein n=1 Tax=Quillaja saponaria TaxID=32244 RepID=A0AAD7QJH9_QUISA|nr:hypothetical protein O6P43_001787 [Quillaja saponaria]